MPLEQTTFEFELPEENNSADDKTISNAEEFIDPAAEKYYCRKMK